MTSDPNACGVNGFVFVSSCSALSALSYSFDFLKQLRVFGNNYFSIQI